MLSSIYLQGSPVLLQQSAAALSLLRDVWALSREVSTATNKGPQSQPGLLSTHTHDAARITPSAVVAQHRAQNSWLAGSQLSSIARLQHTAVDSAGSDEDTTNGSPTTSSSRAQHGPRSTSPCQDQQQLRRRQSQHHHQQQQQQQLHYLATQSPQQQQPQQPQQQVRYEGRLHAPHGRRHAATRSQVDRFISEQLLSCKSLGMLRRIMIKHKATMEPEHVADTLLCLQHLVRAARAARRSGVRQSLPFTHHATSQARSQPRVRAAGEFSRSKLRGSESDGHMEQLMGQMLGELGSMIWFQMGDMTGPDLAKVLYSWAMLEWHPEPELLADVKASFISAAAGGGLQQQGGSARHSAQQQPGQQQWAELEVWQGPWMAAGLWGLVKLGEPCEGRVLQLLQRHLHQLLAYWTPQQLADLAASVALTADEQMAAAVTAGGDEASDASGASSQHQLAELVLGLSHHLMTVLSQQQVQEGSGVLEPVVPLPWPESLLIQLQAALLDAGVPAAQRAAAAVNEIAASAAAAGGNPASAAAGTVPMMVVSNVPQLAWQMLQALVAVGVDISEPTDPATGALIAALSHATKQRSGSAEL